MVEDQEGQTGGNGGSGGGGGNSGGGRPYTNSNTFVAGGSGNTPPVSPSQGNNGGQGGWPGQQGGGGGGVGGGVGAPGSYPTPNGPKVGGNGSSKFNYRITCNLRLEVVEVEVRLSRWIRLVGGYITSHK